MKVIKDFDVWERSTLLTVIGNLPGGKMSEIVKAARVMKLLTMSEDEKERAKFSVSDEGMLRWEENFLSEIEFQEEDWKWLKNKVTEFDNWPFTSAMKLAKLAEKLELL